MALERKPGLRFCAKWSIMDKVDARLHRRDGEMVRDRADDGAVLFPHAEVVVALVCIALYVGAGLVLTDLPNPMLPGAILALNMTVIVIAGGLGGPRAGAATGFFGTALTYLLKLMMGHSDAFELYAILPHAVMGGVAGLVALGNVSRITIALTILVGHALNLCTFLLFGLIPADLLRESSFWNGLLAEIALDVLLISLVLGLIEQEMMGRLPPHVRWSHRQRVGIFLSVLMTAVLIIAHLHHLTLAPYIFFLPVVMAASMVGPLAPFLFAAVLSLPLVHTVVVKGTEGAANEISLIISLNLAALVVGELVDRWRGERRLADARLQKLQRAYELLAETDRIKQEIIQNVSHELRTPLTILLGHLELLADGSLGPLAPEQRYSLEKALAHSRKLAHLVEQITVLQQLGDGVMSYQKIDLPALVQKVISRYESAAARQGCELSFRAEVEPTARVTGDPVLLDHVIAALLDNAIKFSPHGGRIEVRLWREGERIYCTVRDHGIGIAREMQDKVFRRFYQVNGTMTRRYGGMGIGLAIVREVIAAIGGDVWLESVPGEGTTVGFWLPLSSRPPMEEGAAFRLREAQVQ